MNSDFKDLLRSLYESEVEYLVADGYAVIHFTQPRYTKDIDIWLRPSKGNARKLMRAFYDFGVPLVGVSEEDFSEEGNQFSIGVPPSEIDFLTTIPGLEFGPAWEKRVVSMELDFPIYYLSKKDLLTSKRKAGRPQDLADIDEIRRSGAE